MVFRRVLFRSPKTPKPLIAYHDIIVINMKQTLFIDPRIRDNVFIPLLLLMILVSILRYFVTKLMYSPDSPLIAKV